MDDDQTQQFFIDRNNAFTDGSLEAVRAFAEKYDIPASTDDNALKLFITAVRVQYGISTGGEYYKDQLTLAMNGLPVPQQ